MIGRTVGSYTLVEKLGQGGMGEVYLAEHRRMGRRAAIKFLLPALTQDADVVTRFFNEARATSLIKHPNIVEIYDCDVIDGQAYIVMEYLAGESLAATLRRAGPLAGEPIAIAAVIGQIASALAAVHRKEIIHRDLKPENIFLAVEEGSRTPFVAKILDFGIAKLVAPGAGGSNTRTGGLLGTPVYMSPEQCRGLSTIDSRADIYALGCVLFEMATGRQVFVREAAGDLLVAHIIEAPPRISAFRPEIPAWMDDLTNRMLSKSPDDRPSSMEEIVSAMESSLQIGAAELGTRIAPTSALARIPTAAKRASISAAFSQAPPPEPALSASPRAAAGRPALAPPPAPAIGGTRVLSEGSGPLSTSKQVNDSTFGRSASELLPAAIDRHPAKRKTPVLAVALGGLALAGVIAVFLTQSKPTAHRMAPVRVASVATPPPSPAPSPPTSLPISPPSAAALAPPAEPTPAKVTIRVVSRPPGAELWLADETSPRGATPLDLVLRRDSAAVHGTLKAEGFRSAAVVIDPGHSGPIEVALERAKVASASHHHHAAGHHAEHAPAIAAPKPPLAKKPSDGFFGVGD